MSTFQRTIKSGLNDLKRNSWLSIATVLVMVLALVVINGLLLFSVLTQAVVNNLENKIDISVYFKKDTEEDDILKAKFAVSELSEVKNVEYISNNEALARFKTKHADNDVLIQSLEEVGDNPLSASLNIQAKNPNQYASIVGFLEKSQYASSIEKINFYQNEGLIERVNHITASIKNGGFGLSLALALIAILVAFNTIRLAIYSAREEISIMRLVGATNWYIRGPFVFEGVMYGLFAAIIVILIYWPLVLYLSPKVSAFVPGTNLYQYFKQNIFLIFGILSVAGVLLGVFSSIIAIRRYLKI